MRVFPAKSLGAIGLLALCAVAPQAAAQGQVEPPTTAPSWMAPPKHPPADQPSAAPTGPAGQPAGTIIVDPEACRWVQRHEPAADVTYQPGVDVHGRPVAPADLPGSNPLGSPDWFEIGITVDVAGQLGIPSDALYYGEAYLGTVTVEGNRVLFNGVPIVSEAEQELVALCSGRPVGR